LQDFCPWWNLTDFAVAAKGLEACTAAGQRCSWAQKGFFIAIFSALGWMKAEGYLSFSSQILISHVS